MDQYFARIEIVRPAQKELRKSDAFFRGQDVKSNNLLTTYAQFQAIIAQKKLKQWFCLGLYTNVGTRRD